MKECFEGAAQLFCLVAMHTNLHVSWNYKSLRNKLVSLPDTQNLKWNKISRKTLMFGKFIIKLCFGISWLFILLCTAADNWYY